MNVKVLLVAVVATIGGTGCDKQAGGSAAGNHGGVAGPGGGGSDGDGGRGGAADGAAGRGPAGAGDGGGAAGLAGGSGGVGGAGTAGRAGGAAGAGGVGAAGRGGGGRGGAAIGGFGGATAACSAPMTCEGFDNRPDAGLKAVISCLSPAAAPANVALTLFIYGRHLAIAGNANAIVTIGSIPFNGLPITPCQLEVHIPADAIAAAQQAAVVVSPGGWTAMSEPALLTIQ